MDLAEHKTPASFWVTISNKVYGVADFYFDHPGDCKWSWTSLDKMKPLLTLRFIPQTPWIRTFLPKSTLVNSTKPPHV
ncbi:hypothetical protein PAXRUDRAFT_822742, partial [Paxillus rubicundulus Ve08.2h10]